MPRQISEEELKAAIDGQTFIKGGVAANAEGIKYDFRMSNRVLKAAFNQPVDITQLPEAERAGVAVEPGEVVFVLTEEQLDLPKNLKAELSQKRRMSHQGIMAVGGFCIDPLYAGRLLIGLYNFSSSPFPLRPGIKLIAAVFYELREDEVAAFPVPAPIQDFPDELIRLMENYKPVSAEALMQAVQHMEAEFDRMREEFRDKESWYEKFRESLDRHDGQIEKFLRGLEKEKDERLRGHEDMRKELSNMSKMAIGTAAIVGIIVPLLISLILFLLQAGKSNGG